MQQREWQLLFAVDDHSLWHIRAVRVRLQAAGAQGSSELEEGGYPVPADTAAVAVMWRDISEQIQTDLETFGQQRGKLPGNMLQQLYNLVDMIVIGKFEGATALAAVGTSSILANFFVAFAFGASMGASIVISQLFGAKKMGRMKTAIKTGDSSILDQLPSSFEMLLGNTSNGLGAGTIGEICALALIIGLCYMLWKKIITWHIPVSIICTVFVFSGLLHLASPVYANPVQVVLSGGLLLGAIFMATDYVTSPMTAKGQLIYGVSIGLLTVVIRNWGSYPEGMSFAILIMNAFTPLINTYIKPKRFGEIPQK
jgi:electron transport complex protein RnfD